MRTIKYFIPFEKLPKAPFIIAHFHQDELILIKTGFKKNYLTLTSTSRDGELMTKVLTKMGFICIRGSSNKKPVSALLNLITYATENNSICVMAVDGPKGPIYKVKSGVLMFAKKTGYPILPIVAKPSKAFCLKKSWNQALIPLPFSKVIIEFAEPIFVDTEATDLDIYKEKLEAELLRLKKY